MEPTGFEPVTSCLQSRRSNAFFPAKPDNLHSAPICAYPLNGARLVNDSLNADAGLRSAEGWGLGNAPGLRRRRSQADKGLSRDGYAPGPFGPVSRDAEMVGNREALAETCSRGVRGPSHDLAALASPRMSSSGLAALGATARDRPPHCPTARPWRGPRPEQRGDDARRREVAATESGERLGSTPPSVGSRPVI